jgi:hypothetical protein
VAGAFGALADAHDVHPVLAVPAQLGEDTGGRQCNNGDEQNRKNGCLFHVLFLIDKNSHIVFDYMTSDKFPQKKE